MTKIDKMCKALNTTREEMVETIDCINCQGAISSDYIRRIAENVVDFVIEDLYDTADIDNWNDDDVRLAFGRAICDKLHLEY